MRTTIETLKATDMHEFFLIYVISCNLPNGPDKNDLRYQQILTCIAKHQKEHAARSCGPLTSNHY